MAVQVVKADPYHPQMGFVIPFLSQRVIEYAKVSNPEQDPFAVVRTVIGGLYAQDPTLLVLTLLDGSKLVGHLVAQWQHDNVKAWVNVVQYRGDGNIGDAGKEAMAMVEEWAKANKASNLVLVTTGNQGDRWKERGFKPVRGISCKELGAEG